MAGSGRRREPRRARPWLSAAATGAAAALAVFASGQEPPAQETRAVPTFPTRAELVTVDVLVLDAKGEPVRGLTTGDFALYEDGKPQAIATLEAFDFDAPPRAGPAPAVPSPSAASVAAVPRRGEGRPFILLVDDMSLAPSRTEDVRKALRRFLEGGVRDGDRVVFATTSGDAWWTARMPEDHDDLLALVARIQGHGLSD